MAKHPKVKLSVDQRAAGIKWLIFGVVLPLLPFAARALAAWLDGASSSLSFRALFGDGELLVVATVISAAVIGDLLFDFTGFNARREQNLKAGLCAFSLVVVVASVLMFGLATLDNQQRADAVQRAQDQEVKQATLASQLSTASIQDQSLASNLAARARQLDTQAQTAKSKAVDEANGTSASGTTGLAGEGPIYQDLRQQAKDLAAEADRTNARATTLAKQAATVRQQADKVIITSFASLDRGESQTAAMSVVMFLFALLTGALALKFSTTETNEKLQPGKGAMSADLETVSERTRIRPHLDSNGA